MCNINVSYKTNVRLYKINYLKLCSMIGLMIMSNDFHSPRSFEFTSRPSETMGVISSPKNSCVIIKRV